MFSGGRERVYWEQMGEKLATGETCFTFALRFWTFRDSFKLVKLVLRALHSGSVTFLEINLVRKWLINVKWNLVKIFSLKKNKRNTSSYSTKNQILSLQENSLLFLQAITSSFV